MANHAEHYNRYAVRKKPLTVQTDAARFHSWDAARRAAPNRAAKEARAAAYGVSVSLIEKQQLPNGGLVDQGRKNFFERELEAINGAIASGVNVFDAIAGQVWILRKLGYRVAGRGAPVEVDAHQVAADVARHSGDLAAYIVESMADDVLSIDERRGIQKRIERCIRAYIGAEAMAQVYTA